MSKKFGAFWSYSRAVDPKFMKQLVNELQLEVGNLIGYDFEIWRDTKNITTGEYWEKEIKKNILASQIFIPIVTPRWINSEWCLKEYSLFLESKAAENAIILPIHYIESEIYREGYRPQGDIEEDLLARQRKDWLDVRKCLRQNSINHQDITDKIHELAEEIAKLIQKKLKTGNVKLSQKNLDKNNPAILEEPTQNHNNLEKRIVAPQETPKRPDGPGRIEATAGGNYKLSHNEVEIKIATEFRQVEVRTSKYSFPIWVTKATVHVNYEGCTFNIDNCYGVKESELIDGVSYNKLGEWEISHKNNKPLEGDYFPGGRSCELINCGKKTKTLVRILVEPQNLFVDTKKTKDKKSEKLEFANITQEKLIAIWMKERMLENVDKIQDQYILHEAKVVTKLSP